MKIFKLSRPENLGVVETETDRDWTKVVETETLTRVSLFSGLDKTIPDQTRQYKRI